VDPCKLAKKRQDLQAQIASFLANMPFAVDESTWKASTFIVPQHDVDDRCDESGWASYTSEGFTVPHTSAWNPLESMTLTLNYMMI
jgi:hypothetical protein